MACSAIPAPAGYSIAAADFSRQALATKALTISSYRIGKITHKAVAESLGIAFDDPATLMAA